MGFVKKKSCTCPVAAAAWAHYACAAVQNLSRVWYEILEISRELLDTASTYTKYHEHYFLNNQILLFHASAVRISNMRKNQ